MTDATKKPRYSILIVDDDEILLETTVAALQLHHDVIGTTQPLRGLKLVASKDFHVLIADWMMPGMDGIKFFQEAQKLNGAIACLLITGRMESLTEEVGYQQRKLLGLLAKPFSPKQLLDRVEHFGRVSSMKKTVRGIRGSV